MYQYSGTIDILVDLKLIKAKLLIILLSAKEREKNHFVIKCQFTNLNFVGIS